MDRIIAIYASAALADRTRVQLGAQGVPTDRLDVVSLVDRGRVVDLPGKSRPESMAAYFRNLLDDDEEQPLVDAIVNSIHEGRAALVVHPRGKVEIEMISKTLEKHAPETVLWRVAPEEAQGGLLGEHAAGFKL
ncbi:MAG: hypothetical protein QM696_10610 [Steroidobacteraceae bacterium]